MSHLTGQGIYNERWQGDSGEGRKGGNPSSRPSFWDPHPEWSPFSTRGSQETAATTHVEGTQGSHSTWRYNICFTQSSMASHHSTWQVFIIDLASETRLPRPHCLRHLCYVLSSSNEWLSAVRKFVCIVVFTFCICCIAFLLRCSPSLCREHSEAATRVDQNQSSRTDW